MNGRIHVRALVAHLRLPFQLLLAPIFLWGWLVSGGGWSLNVLEAFVAFHVFLYGGVTAFNSYYDRDEGPVGGMAVPPPVTRDLLPFALLMQGIGWILAWLVDPLVFWIYAAFVGLSFAYSHPRVRLKARPIASLVVVGFGQGVLAFLAAWATQRHELASVWAPQGVLGASAAALVVVGLYPLTQLYQIEEDRARGDRTLAVVFGAAASFGVAVASLALGGVLLIGVIGGRFGRLDAAVVGTGLLIQLALLAIWARRFEPQRIMANYRRVMRLNAACAAALSVYLVLRLISP